MCDMVTIGGKGNILEHCVHRRTHGQPNSSISPSNFVAGGIKIFFHDIHWKIKNNFSLANFNQSFYIASWLIKTIN
jgi:hypothetical protein